jgi:hypothetical protein
MPIRSKAEEAGIIGPEDLELLGRVFQATGTPGETSTDREYRAFRLISHFKSGIRDEAELRDLIAGAADQASTGQHH